MPPKRKPTSSASPKGKQLGEDEETVTIQRLLNTRNAMSVSTDLQKFLQMSFSSRIVDSQQLSLRCPISKMRIEHPVRGGAGSDPCQHTAVFCARSYLNQTRTTASTTDCPVCGKSISPGDLEYDFWIKEGILDVSDPSCTLVTVFPDGSVEKPIASLRYNEGDSLQLDPFMSRFSISADASRSRQKESTNRERQSPPSAPPLLDVTDSKTPAVSVEAASFSSLMDSASSLPYDATLSSWNMSSAVKSDLQLFRSTVGAQKSDGGIGKNDETGATSDSQLFHPTDTEKRNDDVGKDDEGKKEEVIPTVSESQSNRTTSTELNNKITYLSNMISSSSEANEKLTSRNALLTDVVKELQRKLALKEDVVDELRRYGLRQDQQLTALSGNGLLAPIVTATSGKSSSAAVLAPYENGGRSTVTTTGKIAYRLEAPLPSLAPEFVAALESEASDLRSLQESVMKRRDKEHATELRRQSEYLKRVLAGKEKEIVGLQLKLRETMVTANRESMHDSRKSNHHSNTSGLGNQLVDVSKMQQALHDAEERFEDAKREAVQAEAVRGEQRRRGMEMELGFIRNTLDEHVARIKHLEESYSEAQRNVGEKETEVAKLKGDLDMQYETIMADLKQKGWKQIVEDEFMTVPVKEYREREAKVGELEAAISQELEKSQGLQHKLEEMHEDNMEKYHSICKLEQSLAQSEQMMSQSQQLQQQQRQDSGSSGVLAPDSPTMLRQLQREMDTAAEKWESEKRGKDAAIYTLEQQVAMLEKQIRIRDDENKHDFDDDGDLLDVSSPTASSKTATAAIAGGASKTASGGNLTANNNPPRGGGGRRKSSVLVEFNTTSPVSFKTKNQTKAGSTSGVSHQQQLSEAKPNATTGGASPTHSTSPTATGTEVDPSVVPPPGQAAKSQGRGGGESKGTLAGASSSASHSSLSSVNAGGSSSNSHGGGKSSRRKSTVQSKVKEKPLSTKESVNKTTEGEGTSPNTKPTVEATSIPGQHQQQQQAADSQSKEELQDLPTSTPPTSAAALTPEPTRTPITQPMVSTAAPEANPDPSYSRHSSSSPSSLQKRRTPTPVSTPTTAGAATAAASAASATSATHHTTRLSRPTPPPPPSPAIQDDVDLVMQEIKQSSAASAAGGGVLDGGGGGSGMIGMGVMGGCGVGGVGVGGGGSVLRTKGGSAARPKLITLQERNATLRVELVDAQLRLLLYYATTTMLPVGVGGSGGGGGGCRAQTDCYVPSHTLMSSSSSCSASSASSSLTGGGSDSTASASNNPIEYTAIPPSNRQDMLTDQNRALTAELMRRLRLLRSMDAAPPPWRPESQLTHAAEALLAEDAHEYSHRLAHHHYGLNYHHYFTPSWQRKPPLPVAVLQRQQGDFFIKRQQPSPLPPPGGGEEGRREKIVKNNRKTMQNDKNGKAVRRDGVPATEDSTVSALGDSSSSTSSRNSSACTSPHPNPTTPRPLIPLHTIRPDLTAEDDLTHEAEYEFFSGRSNTLPFSFTSSSSSSTTPQPPTGRGTAVHLSGGGMFQQPVGSGGGGGSRRRRPLTARHRMHQLPLAVSVANKQQQHSSVHRISSCSGIGGASSGGGGNEGMSHTPSSSSARQPPGQRRGRFFFSSTPRNDERSDGSADDDDDEVEQVEVGRGGSSSESRSHLHYHEGGGQAQATITTMNTASKKRPTPHHPSITRRRQLQHQHQQQKHSTIVSNNRRITPTTPRLGLVRSSNGSRSCGRCSDDEERSLTAAGAEGDSGGAGVQTMSATAQTPPRQQSAVGAEKEGQRRPELPSSSWRRQGAGEKSKKGNDADDISSMSSKTSHGNTTSTTTATTTEATRLRRAKIDAAADRLRRRDEDEDGDIGMWVGGDAFNLTRGGSRSYK